MKTICRGCRRPFEPEKDERAGWTEFCSTCHGKIRAELDKIAKPLSLGLLTQLWEGAT